MWEKIGEHTEYIRTTRLQLGCTPEIEHFWGMTYFVGCVDAHEVAGGVLCSTPDFDEARRVYEDAAHALRFTSNVHSVIASYVRRFDMIAVS